MENKNYVYFWKPQQKNGFLSQWYRSTFFCDGNSFPSAEHYMMWRKAILFEGKESKTAKCILNEFRMDKVRRLGRLVKGFDESVWKSYREEIVRVANRAKFSQNQHLLEFLCSFEDPYFVEASPYDRIWGIGYDENNAEKNKDTWGENLLGKILTEVYNELKLVK